jgi:hypothetical protein
MRTDGKAAPMPLAGRQQFTDQRFDAFADLVANDADGVDALARGVIEFPVLVAPAGEVGQTSPQPMVMTTLDASESATARILGF